MNSLVAAVFVGVAIAGFLAMVGAWLLREFRPWLPLMFFGALGFVAAAWAALRVLGGVFSAQGVAYTIGVGEAGDLVWPGAVRVTTLLLAAELATLGVWVSDYRSDRGPRRPVHGWLWAHASGPCRVVWHTTVAPLMFVRDLAHRRAGGWPTRPRHRFEVATVCGELWTDTTQGVCALFTRAGRARLRAFRDVTRTESVPTSTPAAPAITVIDGEVGTVTLIHTWPPIALPVPDEREEVSA